MHRPFRARILTALLALSFTAGFGGLPQAVLCISNDHVAVEVLRSSTCHPTTVEALAFRDHHCADGCEDTPLGSGPGIRASDGPENVGDGRAPAVARLPAGDVPVPLPARPNRPIAVIDPDPATSRSGITVLLC